MTQGSGENLLPSQLAALVRKGDFSLMWITSGLPTTRPRLDQRWTLPLVRTEEKTTVVHTW